MAAPIVCFAVKGGSGTTVIASVMALIASRTAPTLLVDLAGDCAAALGIPDPVGPGVGEWLQSAGAGADALARLSVPVAGELRLVGPGRHAPPHGARWGELGAALGAMDGVVVDAGTGDPPPELLAAAGASLLVIRPCYLALRRASRLAAPPTAVVLVEEAGRALDSRAVEQALGVPVVAEVPVDPVVARAVDAGLLTARLPRSLVHQLRSAA